jgi:hypothetical protein
MDKTMKTIIRTFLMSITLLIAGCVLLSAFISFITWNTEPISNLFTASFLRFLFMTSAVITVIIYINKNLK